MSTPQQLLFFVRSREPEVLSLVGFYRDDLRALRELGFDITVVTRVRDLLKHRRADLVYAWWFGYGFFAVLWARLLGVPSVLTGVVHTVEGGGLSDWPLFKRLLMKAALRLATRTLFISRADFARLGASRARVPQVIYCAVDLETHRPGAAPAQRCVVSISHLTPDNVPRKMVLESISAFARFHAAHPGYRYIIVGLHGAATETVRRHVEALGLASAVELPGRVSFERKLQLLQTATAYLQPSRCEGFGLAILEAEACGCPVVTNSEACIVEINADAVLYGETVDEMAAQLAALADDPALREQMRARGLENAARFSYQARREGLRGVLASLGLTQAAPAMAAAAGD